MLKRTKILSITACALIILGIIIFGITAINANFNFNKIFYAYDYQSKIYTDDLSNIDEISIDLKEVSIQIYESENSEFKVSYNEYENFEYNITTINNKLNISIDDKQWFEYLTFKLPLNNNASIYIPTNYIGEIKIKNNNVSIIDESLTEKIQLI